MPRRTRKHPRIRARNVVAALSTPETRLTGCAVENISLGGMLVATGGRLPDGTKVDVELVGQGMRRAVKSTALVVGLEANPPRMRLEFQEIEEESRGRLVQLLQSLGLKVSAAGPGPGPRGVPPTNAEASASSALRVVAPHTPSPELTRRMPASALPGASLQPAVPSPLPPRAAAVGALEPARRTAKDVEQGSAPHEPRPCPPEPMTDALEALDVELSTGILNVAPGASNMGETVVARGAAVQKQPPAQPAEAPRLDTPTAPQSARAIPPAAAPTGAGESTSAEVANQRLMIQLRGLLLQLEEAQRRISIQEAEIAALRSQLSQFTPGAPAQESVP